jgi:hypothetical protein
MITPLEICLMQWNILNQRAQKMMDSISDEKFFAPIMPGGNSPSWLMGHLADTDDKLLGMFGIRERMFPELSTIYHHERSTNQNGHLTRAELSIKWKAVLAELDRAYNNMSESDWLSRHTAVSAEEFIKEPHRNKLNVMLGRISHKASHLGQVAMQAK